MVDQRVVSERQVATEQNDMGPGLGLQIDFDQDHDIERLAELLVQALHLIDARFDLLSGRGLLQVLSWQGLVSEPVTVFLVRSMPLVEAGIGQIQGRVTAQLGNQLQAALLHHVPGRMVAKMAIQNQIGQLDPPGHEIELRLQHGLDAEQFGR